MTHGVVLIVVPPASPIEDMDGLKGKTVGVIAGDTNRQVIAAVTKEYALGSVKVNFKDLTLTEVPQAFQTRQIQALLVVMPLSEKYITMLREIFRATRRLRLASCPSSRRALSRRFRRRIRVIELPKGTLRGSPPVPDDDLTTFACPVLSRRQQESER